MTTQILKGPPKLHAQGKQGDIANSISRQNRHISLSSGTHKVYSDTHVHTYKPHPGGTEYTVRKLNENLSFEEYLEEAVHTKRVAVDWDAVKSGSAGVSAPISTTPGGIKVHYYPTASESNKKFPVLIPHNEWKKHSGSFRTLEESEDGTLEEAIHVDGHDLYRFTHGKRPSGEGNWIIGVGKKTVDFQKHKEGEHYIQHNGKLSDALKKAKEVAKQHKQHTVHIQT